MPTAHHRRSLITLAAVLLLATGCSSHNKPPAAQAPLPSEPQQQIASPVQAIPPADQEKRDEQSLTCRDERIILESERNRAACFRLQPGITTTKVVKRQVPAKKAKTAKASGKKGTKTTAAAHVATETKVVRTTGRCQPQSLIYARCRTGIDTCKLGDTSPVQWFACARKNGATSALPLIGSVMVLDVNARRGMPTGHPAYVEAVEKNGNGTWRLRISHTNYDRKCHLDQDATVLFDPERMTASFETGPWATWAKNLKALGFILR